jgi:hypothetical protein
MLISEHYVAVVSKNLNFFYLCDVAISCRFLLISLGQWMRIGCTEVHHLVLVRISMTLLSTFRHFHKPLQQLLFGLSNWIPSLLLTWAKVDSARTLAIKESAWISMFC